MEHHKTLIVVDMQNDFITGPLGSPKAREIVPKVRDKITEYMNHGDEIIFTQDTHTLDWSLELSTFPRHCIAWTPGWNIADDIAEAVIDKGPLNPDSNVPSNVEVIMKFGFGYDAWDISVDNEGNISDRYFYSIEIVGLCTDICVIANALALRSMFPDTEITVDASCCAGTTPEKHKAAIEIMKGCLINVKGE